MTILPPHRSDARSATDEISSRWLINRTEDPFCWIRLITATMPLAEIRSIPEIGSSKRHNLDFRASIGQPVKKRRLHFILLSSLSIINHLNFFYLSTEWLQATGL